MSFKRFATQTFIVDTANAYTERRITKREFLRRMGLAGTGFSGTTRHLEVVKWTIDNAIATEPHMPLWADLSTHEIPTELGKLLTHQAYGGDAKKCTDALASIVDARIEAAGLR